MFLITNKSQIQKLKQPLALLVLGAIFCFGGLTTGCGEGDAEGGGEGRGRGFGGAGFNGNFDSQAAIPVQVAPVKRGDISVYLLQTTTLEPIRQVEILAKVAGQVETLSAEEGREVKKGDLLAKLDEDEIKIDYNRARIQMETDKTVFERSRQMLEENLIAEENFDTARLQFESSKSAFEAAALQLEYTNIRSPIAGVVTMRNIEIGQRASVNESLFQVADFNPLRARIYVPEKDIRRVFQGQPARITVDSAPGATFTGKVEMISPVVDPASGTAKVTIDITDPSKKLKPGMFASVFISTETHKNTLIIPKKALLLDSEDDQVFVNENGVARKTKLKIGFTSGDTVEVLSGLQEGDQVVTVGQDGLRTGLPVRTPEQSAKMTQAGPDSLKVTRMADGQSRPGAGEQGGWQGRPGGGGGQGGFGGPPDPERLKRMEERLMQNPEVKAEYEKRVKADPDLKNNPEKKMAFFREMFAKMRGQ